MDVFDFLDWLSTPPPSSGTVVALRSGRGASAATMNQRIAAVRGLFEFAVITGVRDDCPVPAARRSSGARAKRRGLFGHVSSGRPRTGGRLVREARRLPESLDAGDVDEFFADLLTYRDRAIVLAMLLGGLRAGEVRSLRLADVDVGLRQVRVVGKGGRERVVPVHRRFFVEVTNYLRHERPADSSAAECFVVLRGPTTGQRDDRGRDAQDLPHPSRTHRRHPGPTAPSAAHLWHRSRRRLAWICWCCAS